MREAEWSSLFRRSITLADFAGTRTRMTPEEVLARYPGPVTLYAGKIDTVGAPLVVALCSAAFFFFDINDGKTIATAIVIGGFALVYALVNYFRETTLELTAWGFATKDFGSAKTRCAWRAASEFRTKWQYSGVSIIYIDANYDEAVFGPERSVPGVYPFNAPMMAALMNAWRERALGIGPIGNSE